MRTAPQCWTEFFVSPGRDGALRRPRASQRDAPTIAARRGYLLLECLVYMGALAVIMAVAMRGFYHCWNDNKALRHNADDIIRVLHAGEQWRADLRAAAGPVQSIQDGDAQQLRIPCAAGPIIYTFAKGELRRQTSLPAATNLLFTNLHSSYMQLDPRRRVTPWTWELQLNPTRKNTKVCPLFTFETVAGPANIR